MFIRILLTLWFALLLAACAAPRPAPSAAPLEGAFTLLTYNIDGLPPLLKLYANDPAHLTPLIAARLHPYDLVNVQEDFNSHDLLYAGDRHPFRTPTSGPAGTGSGLNTLSAFPFAEPVRHIPWRTSAMTQGNRLTPKGFSLQRLRLPGNALLDVYNLHANAGNTPPACAARRDNLLQLADYIQAHSAGNALLLFGDTNTRYTRPQDNIRELSRRTAAIDVWLECVRHGNPPEPGSPALVRPSLAPADDTSFESIDKIFYRSSPALTLTPTRFFIPDADFRTPDGHPLSDHLPVAATFRYRVNHPEPPAAPPPP